MSNDKTISAGLAFMHAAAAAAVKTAGDRERVRALKDAMEVAIRNCFEFSKTDGPALLNLALETRWGDFRPMDYYLNGCLAGGAYPEMWEAHHQIQPWVARKAIVSRNGLQDFRVVDDHRVTQGIGVLMPNSFDTPDYATLPILDMQVWWVTAFTDELIRVCRYRLTPEELANRNLETAYQHHSRAPFRVRTLLREEWDELNAAPPLEQQAA